MNPRFKPFRIIIKLLYCVSKYSYSFYMISDFRWESVLIITNYSLKAKLILLNNGLLSNICCSIFTRSDLGRIGKEAIKKTITLIDR